MNAVIKYDEAVGYLKKKPSLEPRPDFNNIRALKKHVINALSQIFCPQSAIHGWAGLAMDPATYTAGGNSVCSHQQPRSHGGISPVGGPDHHQNDRRNIPTREKLIPLLQEHREGVL